MNQIIKCSLYTSEEKKATNEIDTISQTPFYSTKKYTQQASLAYTEKESLRFVLTDTTFFFQGQ